MTIRASKTNMGNKSVFKFFMNSFVNRFIWCFGKRPIFCVRLSLYFENSLSLWLYNRCFHMADFWNQYFVVRLYNITMWYHSMYPLYLLRVNLRVTDLFFLILSVLHDWWQLDVGETFCCPKSLYIILNAKRRPHLFKGQPSSRRNYPKVLRVYRLMDKLRLADFGCTNILWLNNSMTFCCVPNHWENFITANLVYVKFCFMIKLYCFISILFISFIFNFKYKFDIYIIIINETQMPQILKYFKPCWLLLILKKVRHPNSYMID